jgi:hypothetical protein
MVEAEHTAETLASHDAAADSGVVVHRCDELVAERLMASLGVVPTVDRRSRGLSVLVVEHAAEA